MDCNTGQRKVFADDVVASLRQVLKKYGLDDIVVLRELNPVLVAARGCLKNVEGNESERVELVLQISPDLQKAEETSQQAALPIATTPTQVARAFDLSEVVARDTVANASVEVDDSCTPES